MRISDWSSDVCSSDLYPQRSARQRRAEAASKIAGGTGSPPIGVCGWEEGRRPLPAWAGLRPEIRLYGQAHFRICAGRGPSRLRRPHRPRSEERRGGKECVSTGRFRWSPDHSKKKQKKTKKK